MKTQTDTKPTGSDTHALLLEVLYKGTRQLAEHAEELDGTVIPPVWVVIARDQERKGAGLKLGHITTAPAWVTGEGDGFLELLITGEGLNRGGRSVFGTLAHEMAHAYNIANKIKDTDSNGRHNKKFKTTAEDVFGLSITEERSIGWSVTEVPDTTAELWAELIAEIDEAITAVAGGLKSAPKPKKRNKNLLKATCECGKVIRASRTVLEECEPMCKVCDSVFKAEETEEEEGED
jgi:hypothetical protein